MGILSGSAASSLADAIALGLDGFLTEPAEHVMADARRHVHFIAGGHYATETFGVRRLGGSLAERFESSTASSTCRTHLGAGRKTHVARGL